MHAGASGTGPIVALAHGGDPAIDLLRDKRAGMAVSFGIHAVVVSTFLFFGYSETDHEAPVITPDRIMTARLVAKGKRRDPKLLNRIQGRRPAKKEATHLGKPAPDAKKKEPAKKKDRDKEEEPAEEDLSADDILKNLLKARPDVRADKTPEKFGSPDGDALGTATTGRTERIYEDKLIRKLNGTVRYSAIDQRELMKLSASIRLEIGPTGKVSSYSFKERSGNPHFDAAVERAVSIFSTDGPRALDPPPEDILSGDVYKVTAKFKPHKN